LKNITEGSGKLDDFEVPEDPEDAWSKLGDGIARAAGTYTETNQEITVNVTYTENAHDPFHQFADDLKIPIAEFQRRDPGSQNGEINLTHAII
jgi:hypothetical protein